MSKRNLEERLSSIEERLSAIESKLQEKAVEMPQRTVKKRRTSITDLFQELKEGGYFSEPRIVREIVEKLAEKGFRYSPNSLTDPLRRAVRSRLLGRISKDGLWAYVSR